MGVKEFFQTGRWWGLDRGELGSNVSEDLAENLKSVSFDGDFKMNKLVNRSDTGRKYFFFFNLKFGNLAPFVGAGLMMGYSRMIAPIAVGRLRFSLT